MRVRLARLLFRGGLWLLWAAAVTDIDGLPGPRGRP
jgi:hypothetical protein